MGKSAGETGATTDQGAAVVSVSSNINLHSSRPTVTGSKGGNAAVASLMSALSQLGLVIDKTS